MPRPSTDTLVCLAIALVYRAPALVHPWGWVNRDGAYGAFVGMHLRQGFVRRRCSPRAPTTRAR